MTEITATEEAVLILHKDGEPEVIVRKNGTIKHYKVVEMNFSDFEQFYEVNRKHE